MHLFRPHALLLLTVNIYNMILSLQTSEYYHLCLYDRLDLWDHIG